MATSKWQTFLIPAAMALFIGCEGVVAVDADGEKPAENDPSAVADFVIDSTPAATVTGTSHPVQWTAVAGAELYRVILARDQACSDVVFSEDVLGTQVDLPVANSGTYSLCVRAVMGDQLIEASNSPFEITLSILAAEPILAWAEDVVAVVDLQEDTAFELSLAINKQAATWRLAPATSAEGCEPSQWQALRIDEATGEITGTPLQAAVGSCTLEVFAKDSTAEISHALTLNVLEVDDPPVWTFAVEKLNFNEDEMATIAASSFTASDPEGDPLEFALAANQTDCSFTNWTQAPAVNASTGEITGQPSQANVGECTLQLTVSANGATTALEMPLRVSPTSDPLVWDAQLPDDTLEAGLAISGWTLAATDVDPGDTPSYVFVDTMSCDTTGWTVPLSVDAVTGAVSGTPGAGNTGVCELWFRAEHPDDAVVQTVQLHIFPTPTAFTFVGGGPDNHFNTDANWSGGTAPSNTDDAVLSAACGLNCQVRFDQTTEVRGLEIHGSFSGTVTQADAITVIVGSTGYDQSAGRVVGGASTFQVNDGPFSLTGGEFVTQGAFLDIRRFGSGNTTTRMVHIENANLDSSVGSVRFYGRGANCTSQDATFEIYTLPKVDFPNLTLDGTNNCGNQPIFRPVAGAELEATGSLIWNKGYLAGNWNLSGNLTTNALPLGGSGRVRFIGDQNQTYEMASGAQLVHFEIEKTAGTVSHTGAHPNVSIRTLTIMDGTFQAPAGTLNFVTNMADGPGFELIDVRLAGSFDHNSGTIELNSSCNQGGGDGYTFDLEAPVDFYNVIINPNAGYACTNGNVPYAAVANLAVQGTLTKTNGNLAGVWYVHGDVADNSPDSSNGALWFVGSGNQTWSRAVANQGQLSGVIVDKPGGKLFLGSDINLAQTAQSLIVLQGDLDLNGNNLTVDSIFQLATGTFLTVNGGTYSPNMQPDFINAGTIQ